MEKVGLFILGKGGVAKAFLRLFPEFRKSLLVVYGKDVSITGIADRSWMIFGEYQNFENLSGAVLKKDLSQHPDSVPFEGFKHVLSVLRDKTSQRTIFLDLSSAEAGKLWSSLLVEGFEVVTANKKPVSGGNPEFDLLKNYCNGKLRYEATVGGGLPIVSTIVRLIRSGDEIFDIRGILSGTMSFIFNELNSGKKFSDCVKEASALGYTEPDPRDDLSGTDVKRKAIILARTMGANISPEHIEAESLVPEDLLGVTPQEFLREISIDDEKHRRSEKIGYVATATPFGARVCLEPLASGDPLSTLSGAENMVCIRTKRYFSHPLVIRGPGAGGDVTAQGVMGDILRVLNVL